MKVYSNLDTFSENNVVLTIGMFDGVHKGHAAILRHVVEKAKSKNLKSAILSFWPHPRIVLNKEPENLQFITTLDEKTKIISEHCIDYLILLPFTKEISNMSAEEFISKVLINKIGLKHLVVGYNHRFGKDRIADYNTYLEISNKLEFELSKEEAVYLEGKAISSTKIRDLITNGKIEEGNQMLGYNFSIFGTVMGGQKLGRRLGYPTANIKPNEKYKLIPSIGVYACFVHVMGKTYGGMLNIGIRPTVNSGKNISIEVHILDFDQDIYSEEIEVTFIKKVRDEKKFAGIDNLTNQLKKDENLIRHILINYSNK